MDKMMGEDIRGAETEQGDSGVVLAEDLHGEEGDDFGKDVMDLDANNDGKLTFKEFWAIPDDVERDDAAMAEERRRAEKVFKQADADGDAVLDKTEAQQFMELYEEMLKQRAEDDEGAETEQGDGSL